LLGIEYPLAEEQGVNGMSLLATWSRPGEPMVDNETEPLTQPSPL